MSNTVVPNQFDRCVNCGATLAPGTKQCPSCNTPVAVQKSGRSPAETPKARRHLRHLLIAAILLTLPHVPQVQNLVPFRLLFWTSPLVLEAITRANQHPETEALFGRPVNAGWLSRGYVWSDETGWSEGKIWIPVDGVKANGTIYARGGQADGPWVFSELRLVRDDGRSLDLLAPIAQPSLIPLPTNVRIFIVPLGKVQGLGLDELPAFYRDQYGLSVEVLEAIPLEPETLNPARKQRIVEEMVQLMRRRLPHLAKDKSTFLIGITDEDMYFRDFNWRFTYTAYEPGERAGVVSSSRFVPYPLAGNESLLRARIRKMVTRTIGFVVFRLPRTDDPSSVMYRELYGSASADLMSDSFEGLGSRAVVDEFVTAHGMSPSTPELLPGVSDFDYAKVDGRYPCIHFKNTNDGKSTSAVVGKCAHGFFLDRELDEIEADLRVGTLITRTSDLFVEGKIPLAATRCYRSWDNTPRTLGRNTALSWDLFPIGSRQPYTYIEIITCDGQQLRYERISKGSGYADALYEHRDTATPFLGSRIRWNGNGWDLKLRDGSLYLFPESYYAKKGIDGALIGFRDASGLAVKMERRERRNLKQIIAPDQRSITFEHDSSDRVIKAEDDQKRSVEYRYDHGGRLIEVRGPRFTTRFKYANTYLMEIEENGRRKVEFDYEDKNRVSRLALPDGRSFRIRYDYDPVDKDRIIRAFVTSPDGSVAKFDIPRK
jgi:YD repeat-containing protein